MNLPSKKVIFLAIACFAAAGAVGFAARYTPKTEVKPATAALTVIPQPPLTDESISSSEELKKWKDTLKTVDPTGEAASTPPEKLSATDKIARSIMTTYLSLKQSGGELTPEIKDQIAKNIVTDSEYRGDISPYASQYYFVRDISTARDSSAAALKRYGNAMGEIMKRNAPAESTNELLLLSDAVEKNDRTALAKLDIIIASYKKTLNDFLAVSVPESLAANHVALINGFSLALTSDEGMRKVFEDPVAALTALRQYQDAAQQIGDSITLIKAAFAKQSVTFSESEPGYVFTHAI